MRRSVSGSVTRPKTCSVTIETPYSFISPIEIWLTFFTLLSRVSGHTLAAEGAPLPMTAAAMAAGWKAHVDTAAISGQAAWGAGLPVGRGAQIIQLNPGDRSERTEVQEEQRKR